MAADINLLEQLVDSLKRDPLFAMSLGSKELFHSNLLGFFIANHRAVAAAVTGLTSETEATVYFEKNHTDLEVRIDDEPRLVIENKVFDLPDDEQLLEIAGKYPHLEPRLVLLSLTPPNWGSSNTLSIPEQKGKAWTYRSYDELAESLQPVIPFIKATDSYDGLTLERWLMFIGRLGELAATAGHPGYDESLSPDLDMTKILGPARLDAAVQKMRFQHAARLLRNRGLTDVGVDFTRGSALLEWYLGDHDELRWGWQLQRQQFRLVMIVPDGHEGYGTTLEKKGIREAVAREHKTFFTFGNKAGSRSEMPKNPQAFNGYNPNFVYRYVSVPGLTVRRAVELGLEFAQHTKEHVK